MTTYSSAWAQMDGSTMTYVDDLTVDRAVDGTLRSRVFFSNPGYEFTLVHRLQPADTATFLAFYAAQRAATFDLVWQPDSNTYTDVRFKTPPKVSYVGVEATITVTLVK